MQKKNYYNYNKRNIVTDYNKCPGKEICKKCFWFRKNAGLCSGCNKEYNKRCIKRFCNFNCYKCSGGRGVRTIGYCGRTLVLWDSWKEGIKEILDYPIQDFKTEKVAFKRKLIPMIHSIRDFRIPEEFPQIDAWITPIHKVANRKAKFHSNDLKDYLGLPKDRKLILSTCAPDNYQEMFWSGGHNIDFEKHKIDYWFPGHFSIYHNDSKLYQYLSAKRQQISSVYTKSQFVWFHLGECIPIDFMKPIEKASNILFFTGQIYNEKHKQIIQYDINEAEKLFPAETIFLFVGGSSNFHISSKRTYYETDSNWLILGLRGRNLARIYDENIPRRKVLINNLEEALKDVK